MDTFIYFIGAAFLLIFSLIVLYYVFVFANFTLDIVIGAYWFMRWHKENQLKANPNWKWKRNRFFTFIAAMQICIDVRRNDGRYFDAQGNVWANDSF